MTIELGVTHTNPDTIKKFHRRKFLKGFAVAAGLGLSAGLAACGDPTATNVAPTTAAPRTTNPVPTTAAPTTAAPTTAAATTSAATTAASTTSAVTTSAPTTAAATTSASSTTAAGATTAATSVPAGFTELGKLPASAVPASFSAGGTKGYIYAKSSSEVMVFSNICTHQGCEVPFNQSSQAFVCPCHGSTFSLSGEVVKGPAQTRLPLFQNKVVGGMVYAKLS